MKNAAFVAFLIAALGDTALAGPTGDTTITVPLAAESTIEKTISGSLRLHVWGDATGFEVEVTSKRPVHGCYANLVHSAPHGPDASDVMPWHVTRHYFPNTRSIRVCSRRLAVEVALILPVLSSDGERFTSGMLVVTMKPSKQVPHAGT